MVSYINIPDAQDYFDSSVLNSHTWDNSTDEDKTKALNESTILIDRLNFRGHKTDPTQELEFPRIHLRYDHNHLPVIIPINTNPSGDKDDIKIACCEIALSLLEGIDINKEIDNLNVDNRTLVTTRIGYNRSFPQEHFRAGIPSAKAWLLLRPYLVDGRSIKTHRVN